MPNSPYITRIDARRETDRYGNCKESVIIHATVAVDPRAAGYCPVGAREVLEEARQHKAADPDREVLIQMATDAVAAQ
ncbi:hypothetical protein ACM64Y_13195 [Novispirillum sp. DQ9]|uniref:hypothetical protein n=1 Tax=Novispirillum sp. DQ9 TaxID=3398612 RepID=UPI003C7E1854